MLLHTNLQQHPVKIPAMAEALKMSSSLKKKDKKSMTALAKKKKSKIPFSCD